MGVRGGLGAVPGALREGILGEKVVFGNLHAAEAEIVLFGVRGAQKPLRAPPAPFGTCHDAFGTCFVARAKCKKSIHFQQCIKFSNFPVKNADFHENWHFGAPPHLQNS